MSDELKIILEQLEHLNYLELTALDRHLDDLRYKMLQKEKDEINKFAFVGAK